jgi:hypothetical protein
MLVELELDIAISISMKTIIVVTCRNELQACYIDRKGQSHKCVSALIGHKLQYTLHKQCGSATTFSVKSRSPLLQIRLLMIE